MSVIGRNKLMSVTGRGSRRQSAPSGAVLVKVATGARPVATLL